MNSSGTWQLSKTSNFWDQIAEREHILHIYKDDDNFLDMLAGFVGGGINAGDCVMVIATPAHLQKLEKRLRDHVVGVEVLRSGELYIPVDAEELVSRIMVDGWPDSRIFLDILTSYVLRAEQLGRKVRAFGEVVALLCADGNVEAAIHIEELWNEFMDKHPLSLFCAYPESGLHNNEGNAFNHICSTHSRILSTCSKPLTEVLHRKLVTSVA